MMALTLHHAFTTSHSALEMGGTQQHQAANDNNESHWVETISSGLFLPYVAKLEKKKKTDFQTCIFVYPSTKPPPAFSDGVFW